MGRRLFPFGELILFSAILATGYVIVAAAKATAIPIRRAVMTRLGQAFSAHWPDQVNCALFENGSRYGIGHWSPSGPRAPAKSASKCKWKLRKTRTVVKNRRWAKTAEIPVTNKANPRLWATT